MTKLVKLRVLIVGMGGLGLETAKNLILAGPKKVTLWDSRPATESDLEYNYYLKKGSSIKGNTRAGVLAHSLAELNNYVEVDSLDLPNFQDINDSNVLADFDLVLVCDMFPRDDVNKLNQTLRQANKGLVLANTLGLLGFVLVDFGNAHKIFDKNGENTKQVLISAIDSEGVVTTQEDKRHDLEEGDQVKFTEVVGMEALNGKVFTVDETMTPYTFKIKELVGCKYGKYQRNGILEEVKAVVTVKNSPIESVFNDLEKELINCDYDFENPDKMQLLKFTVNALWTYVSEHGLPQFLEIEKFEQFQQLLKNLGGLGKGDISDESWEKHLNSDILKYVFSFTRGSLSPMNSFFGGIVAQEAVKFTGKFTPIDQIFIQEFYTTCFKHMSFEDTLKNREAVAQNSNSRYLSQIALFGPAVQEEINKTNTLLIGAGALGCEYLKMFSSMGLGCHKNGSVVVTDDDTIEISNLNRQFLFRGYHVGKSKSLTASTVAKEMNNELNIKALQERACPDSENIFTDKFWDGLTFVVNAVDNIKARQYIDQKSVFHEKQLFESGTLGTKCNSQMIIPGKTESYSDSDDPKEKSFPMCTLRSFPYLIEHTIEWARSKFFDLFVQTSKFLKELYEDPDKKMSKMEEEIKNDLSGLIDLYENLQYLLPLVKNPCKEEAFKVARMLYQDFFETKISELLALFPADYTDKDGQLFWKSPKRPPIVIGFNNDDEDHLRYVKACMNILNQIFTKIDFNVSNEELGSLLNSIKIQKKKINVSMDNREAMTDENADKKKNIEANDVRQVIKSFYDLAVKNKKHSFEEVDFEKDDDSNGHIDFITSFANFRASNYSIPVAPRHKVKLIAGKIVPAIATSTAMVVGTVGIEMYKFYLKSEFEQSRNFFSNLAINIFMFSEPIPPKVHKDKEYDPILLGPVKALPVDWNTWSRLEVEGGKTVEEMNADIKKRFGFIVSTIGVGNLSIWNSYMDNTNYRFTMKVEDVLEELGRKRNNGKLYEQLHISGELEDMTDVVCPYVKYKLV